ncbi:uncharacterized protein LOC132624432 [Lycium barbarum]|uniref:uncharacterized protein LOC132624432 n=1 Tax=Lycium barbarum TaxID=112863 RepID=UPI00293F687E|nr:uncharacterized protein LOC132624432 [Lycium barbarum]
MCVCVFIVGLILVLLADVALELFKRDRTLVATLYAADILNALSKKPLTISSENTEGNWEKFIHLLNSGFQRACSHFAIQFNLYILTAFFFFFVLLILLRILGSKSVGVPLEKSLQRKQAGLLLKELWAECELQLAEDGLSELVRKTKILHSAAKAGNVEFLAVLIRNHSDLIWTLNEKAQTIFHVAVLHREEKVFGLIYQIGGMIKHLITFITDEDGNNILHLAGMSGQPSDLNQELDQQLEGELTDGSTSDIEETNVTELPKQFEQELIREIKQIKESEPNKIMPPSLLKLFGAALRMQREIMWFKSKKTDNMVIWSASGNSNF